MIVYPRTILKPLFS